MVDIVTHRSRIGQFKVKAHIQLTAKNRIFSPQNPPRYLLLIALFLVLPWSILGCKTSAPRNPQIGCHISAGNPKYQELASYSLPFMISTKEMNRISYMVNGNQRNRGKPINICYWNKGSSYLTNKQDDIRDIIKNHKPLVLGLGEANFRKEHVLDDVQQHGFTLHLCQVSSVKQV